MVTVSSYTQEATMDNVVSTMISVMTMVMMMKMVKGMIQTAGPAYAKKRYLNKVGSQMSYIHTQNRPWNATQGMLEIRPDCRAWLGDCSCVAIQMYEHSPWIVSRVEWSTRRILVEGGKDVEFRQMGEPYHMVEITKREKDNIKWRQPIWAKITSPIQTNEHYREIVDYLIKSGEEESYTLAPILEDACLETVEWQLPAEKRLVIMSRDIAREWLQRRCNEVTAPGYKERFYNIPLSEQAGLTDIDRMELAGLYGPAYAKSTKNSMWLGGVLVYHSRWSKTETGRDFGGKHYGTRRAGNERLDAIFRSKANQVGPRHAEEQLGIKVVTEYRLDLARIYRANNPILENSGDYKVLEVVTSPQRKELEAQGYTGVAYKNIVEDPGTTSYLVWNDSALLSCEDVMPAGAKKRKVGG